MINALINMAQNYSDQGTVQKIRQMLGDLRNDTVDSLNRVTTPLIASFQENAEE